MNKVIEKFKDLGEKKEIALVIGTVPGYPDLRISFDIIKTIVESGADILELSASFSDPVADGPTLVRAHQKVLSSGVTKNQIFDFYKKISSSFDIPIFVIEYANVIYKIGLDKYFKKLKKSGIDTLIIPDVPLEELSPFYDTSSKHKINFALLVAPTTPHLRLKEIIRKSKSFIYCVSVTGVTGARKSVNPKTIELVKRVKKLTGLPLVVGFGISKPEHIKTLSDCDINGAVICSQVINIVNNNLSDKKRMLGELKNYIVNMKRATKK